MRPERRRQNLWIETADGFVAATWYWPSRIVASATAVVIVPGIAHEERTMNGGLVALAESLAHAGLPALVADLHGCGQSAGQLDDPDIGGRWRAGIRAAVGYARESGAERVIVIGVRLGFALAMDALAEEPLAALVAWAPIASGKRHVRELRVLQRADDADSTTGAIAIAGFSIPAQVAEHVASLDLGRIDRLAAPRILLRDAVEGLHAPWLTRLGTRGTLVEEQVSSQIEGWLFGTGDQPDLPHEDILALTGWCRRLHDELATGAPPPPRRPAHRPAIEFVHRGRRVRETFVEIGPRRLTGVLSEPADAPAGHAVRLLMSTVGPGRTFTDFARDEAARGNTSLRFDFAGFGTSGRDTAPQGGELYTDEGGRDVHAAIEYLREAGHERIYGLGFCAGAWSMMQAEIAPELRVAVAINVALYRQPGPVMPVRAARHLVGLSPRLARHPLLRGVAARMQRRRGKLRQPVEWLIRLCRADVRVLLTYADEDLGLHYLNGQMGQRIREQLRECLTLQTYAGLGHLAEGVAARTRLFGDIADFFARIDREATTARHGDGPATRPYRALPSHL